MKQFITYEQYNELTEEQKDKLDKFLKTKKSIKEALKIVNENGLKLILSMINIGKMIEIIEKNSIAYVIYKRDKTDSFDNIEIKINTGNKWIMKSGNEYELELCDFLWVAVKELLN